MIGACSQAPTFFIFLVAMSVSEWRLIHSLTLAATTRIGPSRMKPTRPKFQPPDDRSLGRALGATRPLWDELVAHLEATYAPIVPEWKPSRTSALGFLRLIRKKRTILYLLPRDGHFLTAFVFGEKATAAVRAGDLPAAVVTALNEARVYAEGRGIRLETRTPQDLAIMKKLAAIKMAH